jgi:DNA (cytosine-5)-methyltransferase 1
MFEDITTRPTVFSQLDLYVAGFPCQSFSIAGKRKGFECPTNGTLFHTLSEFIRINQPKCFILENVKGLVNHDNGRTFQIIKDKLSGSGGSVNDQMFLTDIDGLGYHIHYKVLNTKDFGLPQNRERIFIVGFKDARQFSFPVGEPLTIRLKDILQYEVNKKYYLSDKAIKSIIENTKNLQSSNVNPEIASTLQSPGHACGVYKGANFIKVHSTHTRSTNRPSVQKNKNAGGSGHLSKSDGKSYCLDSKNSQAVEYDKKIRRLTPLECFRLQGFTDEEHNICQEVQSDTQLYKQMGNTISVPVIQAILKNIYNA